MFDFPNSPTNGQIANAPNGSFTWDGVKWAATKYSFPVIATIAALRASTTVTLTAPQCTVQSYAGTTNKGGGVFVYVSTDTTTADNAGTIIVDASSRRWYRLDAQEHMYNVLWFGATGDGTTNDTVAIRAAIALAKVTTGEIFFPPGVYMINGTLEMPSFVLFRGAGINITIIRAITGNFDMVQTTGFTTLTGTGAVTGTRMNGISDLSLDGNKAVGRTVGNCVSWFGYDYRVRNLECYNAPSVGFYSEWGEGALVPVAAGGNSMESHVTALKVFSNTGDGLVWKGPHDTIMIDILAFINGGRGIVFQDWGAGVLNTCHSYGNQGIGIYVDTNPVWMNNVQGENNRSGGGIYVTTKGAIIGSNIVAYENTGYGVSIAGNQSIISNLYIYNNSTDGIDIAGWENTLSSVFTDDNGAAGLVIGPTSARTVVTNVVADSNVGFGVGIYASDTSVTGLLAIFNQGGGAGVAASLASVRLEGELNNNGTGAQFVFNTPTGGNFYDLTIFTIAGQTAWAGNPNDNFARIVCSGASIMNLNTVPYSPVMTAGSVGEYIFGQLLSTAAAGVSSGVPMNVTVISLTAGEWDVSGTVGFAWTVQGAGAQCWVSTASATQPVLGTPGYAMISATIFSDTIISTGTARMFITSTTLVYLGALSGFGSGAGSVFGTIQARRIR